MAVRVRSSWAALPAVLGVAALLAVAVVWEERGEAGELVERGPEGGGGGLRMGEVKGRGMTTSAEQMRMLEEQAKDKSIEAKIKKEAGLLERDRARQEEAKVTLPLSSEIDLVPLSPQPFAGSSVLLPWPFLAPHRWH